MTTSSVIPIYLSVFHKVPVFECLLFRNDQPSVSDKLSVIMYADDTVLSFSHPNFENMIQVLTCELEKVNHE